MRPKASTPAWTAPAAPSQVEMSWSLASAVPPVALVVLCTGSAKRLAQDGIVGRGVGLKNRDVQVTYGDPTKPLVWFKDGGDVNVRILKGDDIVPIPGTKRRMFLEEIAPRGAVAGDRYVDMTAVNG
jgi:hypothetical protein